MTVSRDGNVYVDVAKIAAAIRVDCAERQEGQAWILSRFNGSRERKGHGGEGNDKNQNDFQKLHGWGLRWNESCVSWVWWVLGSF